MSVHGPYAVWDSDDHTFHMGGGEWNVDPRKAEPYASKARARQAIRDCDNGLLFRHRFHVVSIGGNHCQHVETENLGGHDVCARCLKSVCHCCASPTPSPGREG